MNDSELSEWVASLVRPNVRTDLRGLSPTEFEELCARVLEADGFLNVARRRPPDGGVDGTAVTPDGKRLAFQCKHKATGRAVEVGAVRDFESAVRREKADVSLLITNSSFTSVAVSVASEFGITLIDGTTLSNTMVERKAFVQSNAERPSNPRFDYEAFRKSVHHTVNGVA